jgi:hypothetical protein
MQPGTSFRERLVARPPERGLDEFALAASNPIQGDPAVEGLTIDFRAASLDLSPARTCSFERRRVGPAVTRRGQGVSAYRPLHPDALTEAPADRGEGYVLGDHTRLRPPPE